MAQTSVFLSYRHKDSGYAGRLYERLEDKLPGLVFRDVEGIEEGEPWREQVDKALGSARVMVAVIGEFWNAQRLEEADDVVRYEIASCIERGIPILIAVLPGGQLPHRTALARARLERFTDRQAIEILEKTFGRDAERLAEIVKREVQALWPTPPREVTLRVLLNEFSNSSLMGRWLRRIPGCREFFHCRSGHEGYRLAGTFLAGTVLAAAASLAGKTAVLSVEFVPGGTSKFGFLQELNAGPAYLVLIPLFILLAFRFLGSIQAAIRLFESNRRLVWRRTSPESPEESPSLQIGRWNRRLFTPLSLIIAAAGFWLVVLQEIGPGGDLYRLAFGYVQAVHFPEYRRGVTIKTFMEKTGRRVEPIVGVTDQSVIASITGGPTGIAEKLCWGVCIAIHVTAEWLFACFAAWFVVKVAFVLWLIYRAIGSDERFPMELELDMETPAYGLGCCDRAWYALVTAVMVGECIGIASKVANISKGSWSPLAKEFLTARFGQTLVFGLGLLLIGTLLVYTLLLSFKMGLILDDALAMGHEKQKFFSPGLIAAQVGAMCLLLGLSLTGPNWMIPAANGWTAVMRGLGGA